MYVEGGGEIYLNGVTIPPPYNYKIRGVTPRYNQLLVVFCAFTDLSGVTPPIVQEQHNVQSYNVI